MRKILMQWKNCTFIYLLNNGLVDLKESKQCYRQQSNLYWGVQNKSEEVPSET